MPANPKRSSARPGARPGAKRKLPGLKVITGGRGGRVVKENRRPLRDASKPDPSLFAAPQYLNVQGQSIWEAAVRTLTLIDELSYDHIYGLHQLAYAWQKMWKRMNADQDIDYKDNETFRKMLIEYGLTPAARQRMDPRGLARYDRKKPRHSDQAPNATPENPNPEGEDNPFSALLEGKESTKE